MGCSQTEAGRMSGVTGLFNINLFVYTVYLIAFDVMIV